MQSTKRKFLPKFEKPVALQNVTQLTQTDVLNRYVKAEPQKGINYPTQHALLKFFTYMENFLMSPAYKVESSFYIRLFLKMYYLTHIK